MFFLNETLPSDRKKGGIRRRLKKMQPGDVLLVCRLDFVAAVSSLARRLVAWGEQAQVPVTGRNAKRVLFGAVTVPTGHRVVLSRQSAGGAEARAFLTALRRRSRRARTIRLLLDRASAPTAVKTLRLAVELGIELVWLPKQWPELNAMDH